MWTCQPLYVSNGPLCKQSQISTVVVAVSRRKQNLLNHQQFTLYKETSCMHTLLSGTYQYFCARSPELRHRLRFLVHAHSSSPNPPYDCLGILSALIFQEKTQNEPPLTDRLQTAVLQVSDTGPCRCIAANRLWRTAHLPSCRLGGRPCWRSRFPLSLQDWWPSNRMSSVDVSSAKYYNYFLLLVLEKSLHA